MSHKPGISTKILADKDPSIVWAKMREADLEKRPSGSCGVGSEILPAIDQEISTPIEELPPELLARIFVYSLDGFPVRLGGRKLKGLPWTLCLVSSRWRNVALNELRLWNNIYVEYSNISPWRLTMFCHKVLARCQEAPLALEVSTHNYVRADLADLVTPYLRQLSKLQLHFPEYYFPTFLDRPFNKLESVTLGIRPDATWALDTLHFLHAVFASAPTLRCLELRNRSRTINLLHGCLSIPWAQLTELKVAGLCSYKSLLDVLRQCQKLKSLSLIDNVNWTVEKAPDALDIRLPFLESFLYCDQMLYESQSILDHLILPSLKNLSLLEFNAYRAVDCVTPLLERSRCALETLEITTYTLANLTFRLTGAPSTRLRKLKIRTPLTLEVLLPIILGGRPPAVEHLVCCVMARDSGMLFDALEDTLRHVESGTAVWTGPGHMDFREKYHCKRGSGIFERISGLVQRAASLGLVLHIMDIDPSIPCFRGY